MKKDDRHLVSSVIEQNTQRMTLEELAARGNRHVRVISGQKALELIEAIVDRTIARRAVEMADADRERIVKETDEQFRRISRIHSESEALIEQQKTHIQRQMKELQAHRQNQKELVGAVRRREKRLERARQTILSYDAEIDRLSRQLKELQTDEDRLPALVETLLTRLGERDAQAEERMHRSLEGTLDKVKKALHSATAKPVDSPVEATDVLVSKVFDEEMDTNLGRLDVEVSTLEGIADSLDRLRKMRASALEPDDEEATEELR